MVLEKKIVKKSMETLDPRGRANLNPRDFIGRICVGDQRFAYVPYLLLLLAALACFVELQISHFANFTPCEELVPKRHFWKM